MKFTQLVGLLALGLGASPAAASVCKPSKASSSSSVAPSSSSAAPSASPSAVVCDPSANLLANGDFSDGLSGWNYDTAGFVGTDCAPYASCLYVNFGGGISYASQTFTTFDGATYPVNLDFRVLFLYLDNGGWVEVQIGDGNTVQTTWTLNPTPNGWVHYTNSFVATSMTTKMSIVVYGAYGAQVDFTNVFIDTICEFGP